MPPFLLQMALKGLSKGAKGVSRGVTRRRRRRGIPKRILADISTIKAILGPKAATEALHILLSKG